MAIDFFFFFLGLYYVLIRLYARMISINFSVYNMLIWDKIVIKLGGKNLLA